MRRTLSEKEEPAITQWFEGDQRKVIAEKLDMGESTISDIINSLPECLQIARNIAVACRKQNRTLADAWRGLNVDSQLSAVGVTPEQIPIFIQAVKKISTDTRYQPEQLIKAAMKLSELETQSGKQYPQAMAAYEKALNRRKDLDEENKAHEKENAKLRLNIEKNKSLCDEYCEKEKTTPQALSEFLTCRKALQEYGMDLNDTETVRKALDNLKEAGGNPTILVSQMNTLGSIEKSVAYLKWQQALKQDELADLDAKITEYRNTVMQLQEEKNRIEYTIDWQRNNLKAVNYQITQIQGNINELEKRREALITWIGKKLNLTQGQILKLRKDTEFDLMLIAFDNAIKDYLGSH